MLRETKEADRCYSLALSHSPSPQAYVGRARLHELCGRYAEAARFYSTAVATDPSNDAARRAERATARLAALARRMEGLLPEGYRITRVLAHPTWRDGDASLHVGVATASPFALCPGCRLPKLALFRRRGPHLQNTALVNVFGTTEILRARTAGYATAYVGLIASDDAPAALLMATRVLDQRRPSGIPGWYYPATLYDRILYRLDPRRITKMLRAPSVIPPWVKDLDGDGEPEIVTWRQTTFDVEVKHRVIWPTAYTMVSGRYADRTPRFPSLFIGIAPILAEREQQYPLDPKLSDHLGRAYEILGKSSLAIPAFARAERKYRHRADQTAGRRGIVPGEETLYQRAAQVLRDAAEVARLRRLRLETALGDE